MKDTPAQAMARLRWKNVSKEDRAALMSRASKARWDKRSLTPEGK